MNSAIAIVYFISVSLCSNDFEYLGLRRTRLLRNAIACYPSAYGHVPAFHLRPEFRFFYGCIHVVECGHFAVLLFHVLISLIHQNRHSWSRFHHHRAGLRRLTNRSMSPELTPCAWPVSTINLHSDRTASISAFVLALLIFRSTPFCLVLLDCGRSIASVEIK